MDGRCRDRRFVRSSFVARRSSFVVRRSSVRCAVALRRCGAATLRRSDAIVGVVVVVFVGDSLPSVMTGTHLCQSEKKEKTLTRNGRRVVMPGPSSGGPDENAGAHTEAATPVEHVCARRLSAQYNHSPRVKSNSATVNFC